MKIQIEKSEGHYRADCLDLPGTPPVGLGETPEMAVACLFYRMMFESPGGPNSYQRYRWFDSIEKGEPIIVNDKMWSYPPSYLKDLR